MTQPSSVIMMVKDRVNDNYCMLKPMPELHYSSVSPQDAQDDSSDEAGDSVNHVCQISNGTIM